MPAGSPSLINLIAPSTTEHVLHQPLSSLPTEILSHMISCVKYKSTLSLASSALCELGSPFLFEIRRSRPEHHVPVVAMFGTLPPSFVSRITMNFNLDNPKLIDVGSDRPNIKLEVRTMVYSLASFRDVLNLLPEIRKHGGESICMIFYHFLSDKDL